MELIILGVITAILLTVIFAAGFRGTRSWDGLLLFFLIIFLATWAGGLWITPTGPLLFGISWLPAVFVGLLFALVLVALIPPQWTPRDYTSSDVDTRSAGEVIVAGFGMFFWLLLLFLILAIVFGYIS